MYILFSIYILHGTVFFIQKIEIFGGGPKNFNFVKISYEIEIMISLFNEIRISAFDFEIIEISIIF